MGTGGGAEDRRRNCAKRSCALLARSAAHPKIVALRVSSFDYDLPRALIAQEPPKARGESRMLVVDRRAGAWRDASFRELPSLVGSGDCLVVNDSRVMPARLLGRRRGAGAAEVLLLRQVSARPCRWQALARPGKRLQTGAFIDFQGAALEVVGQGENGLRTVEFKGMSAAEAAVWIEAQGHVPLPPYIRRADRLEDRERYQTVFARRNGSAAAPTAGLHFDASALAALQRRGAALAQITLHVGLGTFREVKTETVEEHRMHEERFELPAAAAAAVRSANRVIAVGTTSVRVLEHVAAENRGGIEAASGSTGIFITPGFEFRIVDALLTNFHLPRSTLLMLVSAFAGRGLVMDAYAHAVRERYRFYSYGDCMLIV